MQKLITKESLRIIYVSGVCSNKYFNYLFENISEKPSIAPQKFHYLLVSGLAHFCQSIKSISFTPVSFKKKILKSPIVECENSISFEYAPYNSLNFINRVNIFVHTFLGILSYSIKNGNRNVVVICDTLNLGQSAATVLASFFLKIKIVAIVTDVPIIQHSSLFNLKNLPSIIYSKLMLFFLKKYSSYILLTEHMKVFINNKSYIYLEIKFNIC